MAKIVTVNEFPPIPVRHFDWCAYWDGEEETGDYGYGATEQEAIDELLREYPPCKAKSAYVNADGSCMRCDAENGEMCREQKGSAGGRETP